MDETQVLQPVYTRAQEYQIKCVGQGVRWEDYTLTARRYLSETPWWNLMDQALLRLHVRKGQRFRAYWHAEANSI